MPERRQPPMSELAAAGAFDRLVFMIQELRADVGLRVAVTIGDTKLIRLTFSGTPDMGFPLQREVRDLPGEVIRRIWNEGLRDY